jgi:hypothetical protein
MFQHIKCYDGGEMHAPSGKKSSTGAFFKKNQGGEDSTNGFRKDTI